MAQRKILPPPLRNQEARERASPFFGRNVWRGWVVVWFDIARCPGSGQQTNPSSQRTQSRATEDTEANRIGEGLEGPEDGLALMTCDESNRSGNLGFSSVTSVPPL